jgi:16S rRNA (cytosine1402-N4)-methyltransferase
MAGPDRRMGEENGRPSGSAASRPRAYRQWMSSTPSLRTRWMVGARPKRDPFRNVLVSYASEYHVPVMVAEVLGYLRPERGGLFLDGTLGGGGHAEALLEASEAARVIGIDRDPEARAEAERRLARFGGRFRSVPGNFANAAAVANVAPQSLTGVLLDLGISSRQVDVDDRGFTFRSGAPLDMRMEGATGFESAADLLNSMDEDELAAVFYRYGEEKRSRRLARVIGEMRSVSPLQLSDDLSEAIDRVIFRATPQDRARIFQAVRIAVNEEIVSLERALPSLREALAPGGVMVVLSYHSLEDRIVKDSFREWSRDCICPPGLPICACRGAALGKQLTRKPVMASADEVETNSRARSARLRAWRKT